MCLITELLLIEFLCCITVLNFFATQFTFSHHYSNSNSNSTSCGGKKCYTETKFCGKNVVKQRQNPVLKFKLMNETRFLVDSELYTHSHSPHGFILRGSGMLPGWSYQHFHGSACSCGSLRRHWWSKELLTDRRLHLSPCTHIHRLQWQQRLILLVLYMFCSDN